WIANQNFGLLQVREGRILQKLSWETLGHKDFGSAVAIDRLRGGLWIGFFEGGVTYFKDGVQTSYTANQGLGSGRVDDLQFKDDGSLWISTQGGLRRLKDRG